MTDTLVAEKQMEGLQHRSLLTLAHNGMEGVAYAAVQPVVFTGCIAWFSPSLIADERTSISGLVSTMTGLAHHPVKKGHNYAACHLLRQLCFLLTDVLRKTCIIRFTV